MVNIWDFAWKLGKIRIATIDGDSYVGNTICVTDAEEADDNEDSISIEEKTGRILGFYPSEIAKIEMVK